MPDPDQIDPRWKRKVLTKEEAKEIMKDPYVENFQGGFIPSYKSQDYSTEINNLTERIENLERLLKNIFDGHVLIDGKFKKITV